MSDVAKAGPVKELVLKVLRVENDLREIWTSYSPDDANFEPFVDLSEVIGEMFLEKAKEIDEEFCR
jgi:hypothetical protein